MMEDDDMDAIFLDSDDNFESRPSYSTIHHNNTVSDNDPISALVTNISSANTSDYYYYVYDYDDSVSTLPIGELVAVALVYGTTLLLGVIGNALVIISLMRYRRMRTVTNIFLTSLASADLLLLLLCVPIKFAKWFTFSWEFGEVLCKLVHYLQNVSVICSVLTLTGMSIERYYAIMHPIRAISLCTKSRARRVIGGVWSSSFVLGIPIIFGQVHKEVGVRRKAYWCVQEWPYPVYTQIYEVYMLLLVFIVPFTIICYAYINIGLELWVMTARRQAMRAETDRSKEVASYITENGKVKLTGRSPIGKKRSPQSDDENTKKQVVKMLVIVISLFAVCWAPVLVDNVLAAFGVVEKLHYDPVIKHMRQAFSLMSYANSCINPMVYAFMSKNFRESFMYALCACLPNCKPKDNWTTTRRTKNQVTISFQQQSTNGAAARKPAGVAMRNMHQSDKSTYRNASPDKTAAYTYIQGCPSDTDDEPLDSVRTNLLNKSDISDVEIGL